MKTAREREREREREKYGEREKTRDRALCEREREKERKMEKERKRETPSCPAPCSCPSLCVSAALIVSLCEKRTGSTKRGNIIPSHPLRYNHPPPFPCLASHKIIIKVTELRYFPPCYKQSLTGVLCFSSQDYWTWHRRIENPTTHQPSKYNNRSSRRWQRIV